MNLFDRLVDEVLRARPGLGTLRPVVEKELLHHDILREMAGAGMLADLTFIGGTCLRACYGSERFSEDLDFAGGEDFARENLSRLAPVLEERIGERYSLPVKVGEPKRETVGGVNTWKLTMLTRPERRDLPPQRIHVDVCALPSFDRRPMMLRNLHGVDMGTSGLILQAESLEEILADKLVALALRPNRLKHRDLWDIAWLKRRGIVSGSRLLPLKVKAHRQSSGAFRQALERRTMELRTGTDSRTRRGFVEEMKRFLPAKIARETVENPEFWDYLVETVRQEAATGLKTLL